MSYLHAIIFILSLFSLECNACLDCAGERRWVIWMPAGCGQDSRGEGGTALEAELPSFICSTNTAWAAAGKTLSACLSLALVGAARRSCVPMSSSAKSEQNVPPLQHGISSVQTFWAFCTFWSLKAVPWPKTCLSSQHLHPSLSRKSVGRTPSGLSHCKS